MRPVFVAPSLLASDFGTVVQEVESVQSAGADWLHLDVMDGHFVDNISFGPAFVQAVRKVATIPVDVHLMISRPDHFAERFFKIAHHITVHVEAEHDVTKTLRAIRAAGCTAGLAISPETPVSSVEAYLGEIDLLLIMTVHPGYGGQPFLPEMLGKIEEARRRREELSLNFHIEVDGGINSETARLCLSAGANVLVAGSSVFGAKDRSKAILELRP